jgi:hypothetical protein
MTYFKRIRAESGNAMVLAALILLTLTSVGLVAVQQTHSGLMGAGNVSRATQAGLAGDAGIAHTIALLGSRPDNWTRAVEQMRNLLMSGGGQFTDWTGEVHDASSRLGMTILQRSTSIPDPAGVGQRHHLPSINWADAGARIQQDVAYDGKLIWIKEVRGMAGWEAEGDRCFETFDVNSRGGIPNGVEQVFDTLCPDDVMSVCASDADCTAPATCQVGRCVCVLNTVVVENRARSLAGPVNCVIK